jgi:hypothetical protein
LRDLEFDLEILLVDLLQPPAAAAAPGGLMILVLDHEARDELSEGELWLL